MIRQSKFSKAMVVEVLFTGCRSVLVEVCSPEVGPCLQSLQQHLMVLDACFDFHVYLLDIRMYHYGSICASTKENRKILGLYVEVCIYGLVDIKSL